MGKAIFRQRCGVLGVGIVSECGVVTPQQLIGLGLLAEKTGAHGCKMTTRQTLVMLIPEEMLAALEAGVTELGLRIGVFGNVVRNVKGCPGHEDFCPRTVGDAYSLGVKLQKRFMNESVPKDFKISTAGCHRSCTDPLCADFGVIARARDDFDIFIGGRGGGRKPRHGQPLLQGMTAETVEIVLAYLLDRYREVGEAGERIYATIDRVGLSYFRPPLSLYQHLLEKDDANADFLAFAGEA
ncbi:MAG: nitrite reductase [Dethiobacter sp.]|nr:nitrite reductase [Dethiobacter sp.]MBS3990026.1 nitrite reductase [Dethiobacter sp.]